MNQLSNSQSFVPKQSNKPHAKPLVILIDKSHWSYLKDLHALTPRECQIAKHICWGLRNSDIANHLGITLGTVKAHIRNIYRKTKVKSKIGMLLRFMADAKTLNPDANPSGEIPIESLQANEKLYRSNNIEKI